jgi:hypothetical protein
VPQRRPHRRARHLQPLGQRRLRQARPVGEAVAADQRDDARQEIAASPCGELPVSSRYIVHRHAASAKRACPTERRRSSTLDGMEGSGPGDGGDHPLNISR